MPRPSRLDEAKQVLREFYATHGGMPSVQAFAELMGYASASSAHDVTKKLVAEGFLAKDERGGRLLPGPSFYRAVHPALLGLLPDNVEVRLFHVSVADLMTVGVLPGDILVLGPTQRPDLSEVCLWRSGSRLCLTKEAEAPWQAEGSVLAQYRSYRVGGNQAWASLGSEK